MSNRARKVTVLLPTGEFDRFERYCLSKAFKKSTLIARLVREYLDREGLGLPPKRDDAGMKRGRK